MVQEIFPSNADNKDLLLSEQPIMGAGASIPGTTAAPSPNSTGASSVGGQAIQQPASSSAAPQLPAFSTAQNTLQQTRGNIAAGTQEFYNQAGPERTWGAWGEQQLGDIANAPGGAMTPEQEQASRDIVFADYKGPSSWGEAVGDPAASSIYTNMAGLGDLAQTLRSPGGTSTVVRQQEPGLSRGEARFEGSLLRRDPGFRQQSMDFENQVRRLYGNLAGQQQAAQAYAQTRESQETDIAAQSRDYLLGLQTPIAEGWNQRVAAADLEQANARAAYDRYMQTGDPDLLQSIPERYRSGWDPSDFQTQTNQEAQEAANLWQTLVQGGPGMTQVAAGPMAETPGVTTQQTENIGGTPQPFSTRRLTTAPSSATDRFEQPFLLQPELSSRARETLKFTDDDRATLEGLGMSKKAIQEFKKRLKNYQKDTLEPLFSPHLTRSNVKEEGEFAAYQPMYLRDQVGTYDPVDPRQVMSFDPGVKPTRENLATTEERNVYNRVEQMLGQADQLAEAENPFQAAQVLAQVDDYLTLEEAKISQQKGHLDATAEKRRKDTRRARKRYRTAKRKKVYGRVGGVIGAIALTPAGGPHVGYPIGEKVGESFA